MKATEDELLKFSAELLDEYNIDVEFVKDGIYLQKCIENVRKKLNISNTVNNIVRVGVVAAMDGNELWVKTESDERVTFAVNDENLLHKYYCKKVRVTIELLE